MHASSSPLFRLCTRTSLDGLPFTQAGPGVCFRLRVLPTRAITVPAIPVEHLRQLGFLNGPPDCLALADSAGKVGLAKSC
jgi:hypothetical protein